jgi:hypothetical protein
MSTEGLHTLLTQFLVFINDQGHLASYVTITHMDYLPLVSFLGTVIDRYHNVREIMMRGSAAKLLHGQWHIAVITPQVGPPHKGWVYPGLSSMCMRCI